MVEVVKRLHILIPFATNNDLVDKIEMDGDDVHGGNFGLCDTIESLPTISDSASRKRRLDGFAMEAVPESALPWKEMGRSVCFD